MMGVAGCTHPERLTRVAGARSHPVKEAERIHLRTGAAVESNLRRLRGK